MVIPLLKIGMCFLMHDYLYKIEEISKDTYLLSQRVIVFEEVRTYKELWKIKYIDSNAVKIPCPKDNKYDLYLLIRHGN